MRPFPRTSAARCCNPGIYWAELGDVRYTLAGMKTVRLVPLAFIAGVHGFAMFAPYLAVFLAVAHFARGRGARPTPHAAAIPNFQK